VKHLVDKLSSEPYYFEYVDKYESACQGQTLWPIVQKHKLHIKKVLKN